MARITRVLVADSNPTALNEVSAQLRNAGCLTLIELAAPRIRVRARHERPDVVVLGTGIPADELNRVVEDLKSDPVTGRLPVVLVGAKIVHGKLDSDLMNHIDGVVELPLAEPELANKLAAAVRVKVMRAEQLRRCVTFGRYGIDTGAAFTKNQEPLPRVLLVRPTTGAPAFTPHEIGPFDETDQAMALATLTQLRHDAAIIVGGASEDEAALELCADARRHPALFHMPIIYLSPSSDIARRGGAFLRGASEVLAPPFDAAALKLCLALGIRQSRLRTRLSAAYRNGGHAETNDPVTGLFSPEFLHRHLELLIEDAFRWDRSLTVVTVVMPGLAALSREHGRNAGAALRHAVASLMSRLVRGEDMCAGLNDQTFCIAMPESSIEASAPIINRMRGVIAHTEFAIRDVNRSIRLRPELGNAEYKPGDTVESLLARAQDAALRAAA